MKPAFITIACALLTTAVHAGPITVDPALPAYQAKPVTVAKEAPYRLPDGSVYIVGNDGMKEMLEQFNLLFAKSNPDVRFTMLLEGSSTGIGGLSAGVSALAPMGREAWPTDLGGFKEAYGYQPTDIHIGYDGYARGSGHKNPPGVYVNAKSPLAGLSMSQVTRVFTQGAPSGDITHWRSLGVGGDCAQRAIHVYGPRDDGGFATSARVALLAGRPFTSRYEPMPKFADTMKAVAADPCGIALGQWGDPDALAPQVKLLPLSSEDGAAFALPTPENVQAGRYPMTPHLHVYVNRTPGKPLDPLVKEYLRMALSREGQAVIAALPPGDEPFLPLTAAEAARELAKLD
jgi:phosphate transport system substrate-binding protein